MKLTSDELWNIDLCHEEVARVEMHAICRREFDQIISPKALLCVLFKFLLIQAQAVTSTLLRKAQRLS